MYCILMCSIRSILLNKTFLYIIHIHIDAVTLFLGFIAVMRRDVLKLPFYKWLSNIYFLSMASIDGLYGSLLFLLLLWFGSFFYWLIWIGISQVEKKNVNRRIEEKTRPAFWCVLLNELTRRRIEVKCVMRKLINWS